MLSTFEFFAFPFLVLAFPLLVRMPVLRHDDPTALVNLAWGNPITVFLGDAWRQPKSMDGVIGAEDG
ncbi:MAG TPA: hypothetical protein VJP40_01060, partial [bacterium]|nr:hypothetical protein [bacterium]